MECKLPKKDHTSMKHMTIALLSIDRPHSTGGSKNEKANTGRRQ